MRNTAPHMSDRNEAVRFIQTYSDRRQGRKEWKRHSGYHRRSVVETAFSRMKRKFGDRVTARKPGNQAVQLQLRCDILNRIMASSEGT